MNFKAFAWINYPSKKVFRSTQIVGLFGKTQVQVLIGLTLGSDQPYGQWVLHETRLIHPSVSEGLDLK